MSFLKIRDYYNNFNIISLCKVGVIALGIGAIAAGGISTAIVISDNAAQRTAEIQQKEAATIEKSQNIFQEIDVEETEQNTIYFGESNAKAVLDKTTIADILSQGDFEINYSESYIFDSTDYHEGTLAIYEGFYTSPYFFEVFFFQDCDILNLDLSQVYVEGVSFSHDLVDHTYKFKYCQFDENSTIDEFRTAFANEDYSEDANDTQESIFFHLPDELSISFSHYSEDEYSGERTYFSVRRPVYTYFYSGDNINID